METHNKHNRVEDNDFIARAEINEIIGKFEVKYIHFDDLNSSSKGNPIEHFYPKKEFLKNLKQKQLKDSIFRSLQIKLLLSIRKIQNPKFLVSKVNKINYSFEVLKFLIPSKHREEIIGDLYEMRAELKCTGAGKILIFFIMFINIIYIIIGITRTKLSDLHNPQKKKGSIK